MTQANANQTGEQVLVPLTTPEEVQTFLAQYPLAAVFKAGTCHKTMQGFGVLETFLQRHELPVGFIRVVDWRPASNFVAEQTGLIHHSPQLIIFQDGQPRFEVNNWDITPEALAPVFSALVPARAGGSVETDGNLQPYLDLMDAYLGGQMNDFEFQDRWVPLFRDDASLRSQREFDLLSRLFGDPDAYHGGLHQLGAPASRGDLRPRVEELRRELLALRGQAD
ncbi:thioredoxin family protein [Deinococcus radiophilus]|uniref:Thioredoxin family protein n=1 Tax=Deinococcus radiophilus TaxID=32062 RepID=A0A3S0IB40_9DEIO|nr:thioredoxin family protein [Deinococcus radiophilus]RTR29432.1 thioredoxin family protein [Deinococcus radiophilus]UFA50736.1 thioredoxin family protein [Deinococcus radiophilus]